MTDNKTFKVIMTLAILIVSAALILFFSNILQEDEQTVGTAKIEQEDKSGDADSSDDTSNDDSAEEQTYSHKVTLEDVTNGVEVLGVTTSGNASGEAQSNFENNDYKLLVTFKDLPDPIDEAFYEGWLVDPSSGGFFSTGKVTKDDSGEYVNNYTDSKDWNQSHSRYVLTIEPNDDDPAPADHVVEGDLSQQ